MDSTRVDQQYIDSQGRTYGLDSREYKVRVLGEFPDSGADAVIPREFVESACDRDIDGIDGGVIWGLDPGRGGDPTGFVERTANVLTDALELRYDDLMRVVGYVKKRWDDTTPRLRPQSIFIDSIGLGAGVADRLLELDLPVVHVNVSEVSSMSERYMRLRPEIWYSTRAWFEKKDVKIEQFDKRQQLIEELVSVEQVIMSNGKIDIEKKDDMKRRGVASPNMADALALTFAMGGAIQAGSYSGNSWGKVKTLEYRAPGIV